MAALEWAAAGLYGETQLTGLSDPRRRRHLEPDVGRWRVAASLRERVAALAITQADLSDMCSEISLAHEFGEHGL